MKKIIIFDFDGTIADTFPIVRTLLNDYAKNNLKTDQDFDIIKEIGIKAIIKKLNMPFYKVIYIIIKIQIALSSYMHTIKIFNGLKLVIDKLSKEYTLGIVSSDSRHNINLFLKNNGLHDKFLFIYSRAAVFGKYRIIKKIKRKYNVNHEEIVYVGDEDRDIHSAHKAKIDIIAVSWGYNNKEHLKKQNPTWIADKPSDLLKLIN